MSNSLCNIHIMLYCAKPRACGFIVLLITFGVAPYDFFLITSCSRKVNYRRKLIRI